MRALFLSAVLLLGLYSTPYAQEAKDKPRLVFFDLEVDPALDDVNAAKTFLSRTMGNAFAKNPALTVVDQSTRDSLLLQRKFNLKDCSKAECRFAMARSLPGIDLMAEAQVQKLGRQCALSVAVKSVKTGGIVSSVDEKTQCDADTLIDTLRSAALKVTKDLGAKPDPKTVQVQVGQARTSTANVPPLDSRLQSGTGIAEANAIAAWNVALSADAIGVRNPSNAAEKWEALTKHLARNTLAVLAAERAAFWRTLEDRKQADTLALLKALDTEGVTAQHKKLMIERFSAQYGKESYDDLLKPIARLTVHSDPDWASVSVDGGLWYFLPHGWTSSEISVTPGWHEVEVYKRFYKPEVLRVFSMPNSTVTLSSNLAKDGWEFAGNIGFGAFDAVTGMDAQGTVLTAEFEAMKEWFSLGAWITRLNHFEFNDSYPFGLQVGAHSLILNTIRLRAAIRGGYSTYPQQKTVTCLERSTVTGSCVQRDESVAYAGSVVFAPVLGFEYYKYAQVGLDFGAFVHPGQCPLPTSC